MGKLQEIKPGGSEGGGTLFVFGIGCLLSVAALYFFFDSVHVRTDGGGLITGRFGRGGGWGQPTSMGLIFVPFLISIIALFYDAKKRWAWLLFWVGLAVLVVAILSRIRLHLDVKPAQFLMLFVLFGAGVGMILRSFRDFHRAKEEEGEKDESS